MLRDAYELLFRDTLLNSRLGTKEEFLSLELGIELAELLQKDMELLYVVNQSIKQHVIDALKDRYTHYELFEKETGEHESKSK